MYVYSLCRTGLLYKQLSVVCIYTLHAVYRSVIGLYVHCNNTANISTKHQELAQSHTNYCYHSRKIERSSFLQFFFLRERDYIPRSFVSFLLLATYVYIHIFLNSLLKYLHKMWATANQKYWKHKLIFSCIE